MKRKLLALVIALACSASAAYGASSFMDGYTLTSGQFAIQACASYFYPNDNLLNIPDIGVRVGLSPNTEWGIKVYNFGITTDLKYGFMNSPPFLVALDLELDLASSFGGGAAIIMDLELNSFTAVYVSARWRYPAMYDIDPYFVSIGSANPAGMMFLARFGIEILRHNFLTFNLEGGAVTSWSSPTIGLNVGAMITWKIN